jgi:hypothetical protein
MNIDNNARRPIEQVFNGVSSGARAPLLTEGAALCLSGSPGRLTKPGIHPALSPGRRLPWRASPSRHSTGLDARSLWRFTQRRRRGFATADPPLRGLRPTHCLWHHVGLGPRTHPERVTRKRGVCRGCASQTARLHRAMTPWAASPGAPLRGLNAPSMRPLLRFRPPGGGRLQPDCGPSGWGRTSAPQVLSSCRSPKPNRSFAAGPQQAALVPGGPGTFVDFAAGAAARLSPAVRLVPALQGAGWTPRAICMFENLYRL